MTDEISIAFSADISALEAGIAEAASAVREACETIGTGLDRLEPANPAGARRDADQLTQIYEHTALKHIAAEVQANSALLEMGKESVAAAEQQAVALENARYQVELDGIHKKEAVDAGDKAKLAEDKATEQGLAQEHADRLLAIATVYQQKKQRLQDSDLQQFVKDEDQKLAEGLKHIEAEYKAHKIDAAERQAQEHALTATIETEVVSRFDAEHAGLVQGTEAWSQAFQQRQALVEKFNAQFTAQNDALTEADVKQWQAANSEILSAENGFVSNYLSGRVTLGNALLSMAGQIVEKEIESDLRYWTERGLLALQGTGVENATEKGGMLMNLLFDRQKTASTLTSQAAQTAAVTTGTAIRTGVQKAGAAEGLAAQAAAGSSAVMNDAYQAAAGAYAAVAQIPYIGPFIAPAAAAASFGAVMAFDALTSLDVGAWEIPQNMSANLHKGEMVVPQNFASGMRASGGNAGGDTNFHTTYAPQINMRDPTTLKALLQNSGSELFDAIQRGVRLGLPMRPSMNSW